MIEIVLIIFVILYPWFFISYLEWQKYPELAITFTYHKSISDYNKIEEIYEKNKFKLFLYILTNRNVYKTIFREVFYNDK